MTQEQGEWINRRSLLQLGEVCAAARELIDYGCKTEPYLYPIQFCDAFAKLSFALKKLDEIQHELLGELANELLEGDVKQ